MSEDSFTTCACTLAKQLNFTSNQEAQRSREFAKRALRTECCSHIGMSQLVPKDSEVYAVYSANCFDPDQNGPRCVQGNSKNLVLGAIRLPSPSKRTVTTSVTIQTSPSESLTVENGRDTDGASKLHLGRKVLHPYGGPFTKIGNAWQERIPIKAIQNSEPVPAAIDIQLRVTHESSKMYDAKPINLAVIIPAEESIVMEPISSIVIAKSIELLLQEGWSFLKSHSPFSESADLIQLRIGDAKIREDQSTPLLDSIGTSVRDADIRLTFAKGRELEAWNKLLADKYIEKATLIEEITSSDNAVERAHVKARIEKVASEIADLQERIWKTVSATGKVTIEGGVL